MQMSGYMKTFLQAECDTIQNPPRRNGSKPCRSLSEPEVQRASALKTVLPPAGVSRAALSLRSQRQSISTQESNATSLMAWPCLTQLSELSLCTCSLKEDCASERHVVLFLLTTPSTLDDHAESFLGFNPKMEGGGG